MSQTLLKVFQGGTGLGSGTSGGVPYFSSSSVIGSSAALTANAIIIGGGAGSAPAASSATVDGSGNLAAATVSPSSTSQQTTALYKSAAGGIGLSDGGGQCLNARLQSFVGSPPVNYWVAMGTVAGFIPALFPEGTDTNINAVFLTKGTGAFFFQTNGGNGFGTTQMAISNVASAVNYIAFAGGPTGSGPFIGSNGSDTNPDFNITAQGAGSIGLYNWQSDRSASYQTPGTGFSITIANGVGFLQLDPAGALLTGTITMPAAPTNGQLVGFSSTQTITTLTASPNSGQSIKNAPTTIAGGQGFLYWYRAADSTWYRRY